jgi:hypothetical protein
MMTPYSFRTPLKKINIQKVTAIPLQLSFHKVCVNYTNDHLF